MRTRAKHSTPAAESARVSRRRPQQARARVTAQAIREAFEQLLVERGYERVSIRQIIAHAGVGTGSFYEYFASKAELASVCVHLRVKQIRMDMAEALAGARELPLPARVDAILAAQSAPIFAEPERWRALFLVERQVSDIAAYRKQYAEFVQMWEQVLQQAPGWTAPTPLAEAAFAVHALSYGLISQGLMSSEQAPDAEAWRRQLERAVHGYLSLLEPLAYRLYRFAD